MNKKVKRTGNLYVLLIVLLMAVAVVAAIAGAMNRSRQLAEGLGTEDDSALITSADDGTGKTEDVFKPSNDKETEADTEEDTTVPDTEKTDADPISQFMNPTGGALLNSYSIEVPVFSVTMEDYRTHNGVDIFVNGGDRILAAAAGEIKEIWEDPMMGTCMSIAHSGGIETIYKNLSPNLPEGIAKGVKVTAGEYIAVGGESALEEISEEPHLHFEMKVNGEYVDPCKYIDFSKAEESYED